MEAAMAKASKKHIGPGAPGGHSGGGAMSDLAPGEIGENMVMSNRDKSQHSTERGLDSKEIETEQEREHASNRPSSDAAEQRK
jgi:hypothetical protein